PSLTLGLVAPVLAMVVGGAMGLAAGYCGGIVDRVISRIVDLLLSFPALLLGILVAVALGSSFLNVLIAISAAFVPRFARIVRASTMSKKAEPFVEAALAIGVPHWKIAIVHIVPNIIGPVIAVLTLWTA